MKIGKTGQRTGAALAGLVAALVLLEIALRIGGALFSGQQDRQNRDALEGGDRVILCIGESTTALGGEDAWPRQLQTALRDRTGEPYSVINEGVPGVDSSVLLAQLEANLDQYRPEVVVAMMGANDIPGGAIPFEAVPVAERTGLPHSLKTYKLARQIWHAVGESRSEDAGGDADGFDPSDARNSYSDVVGRGIFLAQNHRYQEAEAIFLAAAEREPSRADAYIELGRLYDNQARSDEAEAMLVAGIDACRVHADHPCDGPRVELARHFEQHERRLEAVDEFRRAIEENGHNAKAWFGLGRVQRKLERFEEAAAAFHRAVDLEPRDAQAHVSLGLCMESLGDLDGALQHLSTGWDLAPGDRRAFIRLADFYERNQMHTAFEDLAAQALDVNPDVDDIPGRIALYHRRTGDPDRAARFQAMADDLRVRATPEMTRENYLAAYRILSERGIRLVTVQYPVRSAEPLQALFADHGDVLVVDNAEVFRDALRTRPYAEIFWDSCYGDFGHATRTGNHMLAASIADALLADTSPPSTSTSTPTSTSDLMLPIPGGTFLMGAVDHDAAARDWEKPRHEVAVSAFLLDRTEVTVAAYAAAVEAGVVAVPGCSPVDAWGERLCNYRHPDRRDHPVNGVSWTDADAYCRWRGARLPTEAEFEYALRAGNAGVVYPWGDAHLPPPGHGNYAGESAPRDRAEGHPLTGYDDGFGLTAPVASFPANAFGVHDLSGNIWEWCSDWFDHDFYSVSPPQDPHGAPAGQRRVLKGGNFYCIREELRVSERHHKRPDDTAVYSGFRCAADAPE